jgi:hypothetical protein
MIGESNIVKVPLFGCHPTGGIGPFQSSIWFYSKTPSEEIMKQYFKEYVPLFLTKLREQLALLGVKEDRGVLWVDCGRDVSHFFTTEEGVKWATDLNLCINLHAAKFTGVAQQLDQANCFRGNNLFLSFLLLCVSFLRVFVCRHQASPQVPYLCRN